MKPNKLLILIVLVLWPGMIFASENMSRADYAKFGQAKSLNNLEKFDQAGEILRELIDAYPENEQVQLEFIRAYGYGLDVAAALRELKKIETRRSGDIDILTLKASILEANQRFSESIYVYKSLLEQTKEDSESALKFLRKIAVSSMWIQDYSNAIEYYEKIKKEKLTVEDRIHLSEAYIQLDKTDQAIAILESLPEKDDKAQVQLIAAYLKVKQLDNAQVLLGKVMEKESLDRQESSVIIDLLAAQGIYDQAIDLCRRMLQERPDDVDILTKLARIESWNKDYEQSLETYDRLIGLTDSDPAFYREKSRVLGWMRNYDSAIEGYELAEEKFSATEVISPEKNAKRNFYRLFDRQAARYYEEWLSAEPENLEALFDLAQVYSRQGLYKRAEEKYIQVIKIYDKHPQANQALKKLRTLKNDIFITGEIKTYEADSNSRAVDHKYISVFSGINIPVDHRVRAGLSNRETWHMFSDLSLVHQNTTEIESAIIFNSMLTASVLYANNHYSDDVSSTHGVKAGLSYLPMDRLRINYTYRHEDIIDNRATLISGLGKDESSIELIGRLTRRLQAGFHFKHADLSDGNQRSDYRADVTYHIRMEPKRLTVRYAFENYNYDEPRSDYFSPSSFHSNRVGLEWQHYLNKREMFWGSNDVYYSLGYESNFDVNDQTGHTLRIGAGKDWSHRFTAKAEYIKQIYEHQSTYGQEGFFLTGRFSF